MALSLQVVDRANFFSHRLYRVLFFLLLFLISASLVIHRKPDTITNPQFYAEDGLVWYADAYNQGPLKPLLLPLGGYFQTINRVAAAASLGFPLQYAPLALLLSAVFIQILPVLFILSSRFDKIIPSYPFRVFLCAVYLLLPNSGETHANLTSAMSRLAILMFLIMIADFPKNIPWKIFDYLTLLIAGLSGPFSILLLPVFLVHEYFAKERKYAHLALVFGAAAVQLLSCFLNLPGHRSPAPLDASILSFFQILSGNVFIAGLAGADLFSIIRHWFWWHTGLLPIGVGVAGLALLLYVLWQSPLELRLFICYASLIFAAALVTPQVSIDKPQWPEMAIGAANRYYLLPILAWVATLSWIFFKGRNRTLKILSGLLMGVLLFYGIPQDYRYAPFQDFNYEKQLRQFELLPSGSRYEFNIYPGGWKMTLIKK